MGHCYSADVDQVFIIGTLHSSIAKTTFAGRAVGHDQNGSLVNYYVTPRGVNLPIGPRAARQPGRQAPRPASTSYCTSYGTSYGTYYQGNNRAKSGPIGPSGAEELDEAGGGGEWSRRPRD